MSKPGSARVAVFSAKPYERAFLETANAMHGHDLVLLDEHLDPQTAPHATGCDVVSAFANDRMDRPTLEILAKLGVKMLALRSAGYNHVDRAAATEFGFTVAHVPAYSPYAVAEHAMALILGLNRKTHIAHNRVRNCDFSLHDLMGFDIHGRTAGLIGTGRIGTAMANILFGFGCRILAYDPKPNDACSRLGVRYVSLNELLRDSDIVSLHCPLTESNRHMIDAAAIAAMKDGVMLINTSRGKLLDSEAVIAALKRGKVGHLGIDVYENEERIFFEDLSAGILQDDALARLLVFPNVLVTAHQAFFTQDALRTIAETTLENISTFTRTGTCSNPVPAISPQPGRLVHST